MKSIKKIAIFLFAQVALFFSACNTGLGDAVDLKGPTVTIISPEARENVSERFDIRGTVTDDFAVGIVTVQVDGNIWQHKNSVWQYKAKDSNNFVSDTESEWISENKKSVEWIIRGATISGAGTFTIEVKALDESGNSSEESSKSRDVIIDKSAPKITISSPPMAQDSNAFKDIIDYKDITKVTQFLTGDFFVSGKTAEENAIQYVEVLIKESGTENELFRKKIVQNESDKTSESDIVVDALRSWEIPVKLGECALGNLDEKQHILNIYTSTCDTAGNDSGLQFHGYACMWKEADKPWIDIILGDESVPKNVYAGSSLLGNAYDDTAIKSVNVTIKAKKDGYNSFFQGFDKKQIYSSSDGAEDENNVYFELPLPTDSDVYYMEIIATDKNGKVSDTKKGWIKVVDKMFPSMEISHTPETEMLFGDKDGNFAIKVISKDESKVASLKMAYIINLTDIVEYSDSNSPKWNSTSKNLKDLAEGKVYEFVPSDTGETIAENNLKRKIYENTIPINIFKDLGIEGNSRKLTSQTFVFRVEDGDQNALTSTYAIQGDIESPKIEFTQLEYYSYEGSTPITRKQEGGDALPAFGERTFVKVYGKISDNSTDVWKNYEKHLALNLTANGYQIEASVDNNDGTFVAEARNLSGASLVFEGTLTDWGGNSKKQKYSFLVDSQTPRVEYISSLEKDGFYKAGEKIKIFIRFNKNLDFQGIPKITLNTGATIEKSGSQVAGLGANDILFEYTVRENDNVASLNVTKADLGTVTNGGADVTSEIQKSIDEIIENDGFGKNLAQMKQIGIITTMPKVTNITFNETENGGTLTITYDKPVTKGSGEVTITQLNSKGEPGVINVPAVLLESEGHTLFEKSPALEEYYELTTNGAIKDDSNNFKADLTSKYVLKYKYDPKHQDYSKITEAYEKTGDHILSKNARAQGVNIDNTGKIVTVEFNSSLPCKGATYKIKVPAGFMQDKNGGSNFKATGEEKTFTASGVEKPVIRINKGTTTFESNQAKQPSKAEFKVDCETPSVSLEYKYDVYTRNALAIRGRGTNKAPIYFNYKTNSAGDFSKSLSSASNVTEITKEGTENRYEKFPYEGIKETKSSTESTGFKQIDIGEKIEIGVSDWQKGMEYDITATAGSVESYAVAYRTVVEINGLEPNFSGEENGIFIIGGDSPSGSNTVQGFPTTWDISNAEPTKRFTEINDENEIVITGAGTANRKIYYFISWAITKDYYFMFLKGKASSNNYNIPTGYATMAQNSYISYFAEYPINPGGYIRILNGTDDYQEPTEDETWDRYTSKGDRAKFDAGKVEFP